MKKIILLLAITFMYSCKDICILNYEVIGTEFPIPFVRMQNEMIRIFDKIDYDRYKLINVNKSEVSYIMEIINSQIYLNKGATERIKNEICNYSVQIAGFYDLKEKTKKIYLNFKYGFVDFKKRESEEEIMIGDDGKETRFDLAIDGGDYFFQAVINTRKNTIHIININGEA